MTQNPRPIMVTIKCITYNHEPYIRQCLEGFVKQQTDFRFVAIVHDDASTDNTAAIVREYAEKYPDIIIPIYETENQYSKRDGSLGRIMRGATEATGCKYIAMCEGDDYWIDPLKLQKQVDYLEQNPDYSMCFTGAYVTSDSDSLSTDLYRNIENREYSGDELISDWIVPTASIIYQSVIQQELPIDKRFIVGDNVIVLTCSSYGKVRGISEKMVVYRRNYSGWVARESRNLGQHLEKWENHYAALIEYFPKYKKSINDLRMYYCAIASLHYMKKFNLKSIKHFVSGMMIGGLAFIKLFVGTIIRKMTK